MVSTTAELPAYAAELTAFHRAFEAELAEGIAALPVAPGMRVLDVCCGDGFYLQLLGRRLSCDGTLIGLDSNDAYIDLASRRLAEHGLECNVQLICSTIERASLDPPCDFVWCAQSLFSLPDPVTALQRVAAFVRPGGIVAILENDTLHQLQLPWPSGLELSVRMAELAALEKSSDNPNKYYVGRRLPEIFNAAGLEPCHCRTQAIDRMTPFDVPLRQFLGAYLARLSLRVTPFLKPSEVVELNALIDPSSERFLLNKPYVSLTWFNYLVSGRRPQ